MKLNLILVNQIESNKIYYNQGKFLIKKKCNLKSQNFLFLKLNNRKLEKIETKEDSSIILEC